MIISVAHRPTNVNRKTTKWITMQTTNFDENQYFANSHHCKHNSAIERDKMLQTIDLWMWPILHRYFLFKAHGTPSFFRYVFCDFLGPKYFINFFEPWRHSVDRWRKLSEKINFFQNIKQFSKIIFLSKSFGMSESTV